MEVERSNPDLIGDVVTLGVLVGGGILAVGWLKAGGTNAIGGWLHNLVPQTSPSTGAPPAPTPPPASPAPAQIGPNANGANSFNFNSAESYAYYHATSHTVSGHGGFGHVGPGGTFVATISARDGGVSGIGGTGTWQQIYQNQIAVGNDSDWSGYAVDFAGVAAPSLGLLSGMDVLFSIDGLSGEHYADLSARAGGAAD